MFSPHDSPAVKDWFQRFDVALKRLPAEERKELHQEVRQHLESLAAANEELGSSPEEARALALTQFGDPEMIGRRLFQEAQKSRSEARLGGRSIGLGIALYSACIVMNALRPHSQDIAPVSTLLAYAPTVLMSLVIGWKYPFHAIKGAFYAYSYCGLALLCYLLPLTVSTHEGTHRPDALDAAVVLTAAHWVGSGLAGLIGLVLSSGSAYLASAAKRGWYKPALADLMLLLPLGHPKSTWKTWSRRASS